MHSAEEAEETNRSMRASRWQPRLPGSAERLKSSVFAVERSAGIFRLLRDSRWRSARLLILCYHGVSQEDEHEALRELYVPADLLRRRMTALRDGGYQVLSLSDGLDRLAAGTLPARAVTITFDDGFVDFSRVAYPILKEFQFPATVYVSTEYVQRQLPAFPAIVAYILWRARGRKADGCGITSDGLPLRTATAPERLATLGRITAGLESMDPVQRDERAAAIAARLGVDYASIKQKRLFYLMTTQELANIDRSLIDVQLHTHRHTQPHDRDLFQKELDDNRTVLTSAGILNSTLRHFCYPNGEVRHELPVWLREQGIRSATTCLPGIADRNCNTLLMPRFVDTQDVSPLKFEAWLCGAAALLPKRG